MTAIRVEVLGPLRLFVDDRPVDVRGPKRRAVLALLAMAQGRALTVDHLLDALWPAELPDSARGALHSHVFRLRGQLGGAGTRLETLDGAYRLAADLDLTRARSLRAAARDADPATAYTLLREAHGLWRGPVLAEFGEVAPLVAAAAGIEQLRTEVTDALVGAGVDAGRAPEVLGLSADTLAAEPLREPAVLLRMRALAATGQAADALAAARGYRHRLAEEAGLDPSPALGELERDVAAGAAADPAAPARARPRAAPRPVTPLVGRDAQVAAVHRLLDAERLVTVLGPGGVGKTRLALEVVGRREPAGVLLLAPVTAADAIPHALAAALNLQVTRGDVLAACVAHLAAGPALLLVDNCEHLLDAVRDAVAALLDGCPQLTVLTTSREPLGLTGECASRLAPLPVPAVEDGRALERVPSVAVFLDRAARVRPGFAPDAAELRLVAGIVRRLDGMPLAIELAAGRLSTFSPAELADRLQRSLDLLGGARPAADARHRTLRATIDWSYRLLPEPEQRLFRHLAVFPDGVDLATAETVAADLGADGDPARALAHLVDASMIDAITGAITGAAGTRYRMLETLRAFGLDRLAATGEQDAAVQQLLAWARDLTGWIDATIKGPDEPRADAALRRELPNLRAAWRLARDRDDRDTAAAMVARLHEAVVWRDLIEIRAWAEELTGQPGIPPIVLAAAARAAYMRGDPDAAESRARACLDLGDDAAVWHGSNALALVHLARGEFGQVIERELAAAALATHTDGSLGVAALAAAYAGDLARARELNARLAAGAASPTLHAFTAYVAGEIDSTAADPVAAQERYLRAIELARASGATFVVGIASVGRLTVLVETGQHADALRGYRDVIDYFARTGNWSHLWTTLRNLARLLRRLGDGPTADLLDDAADNAPDAPPVPDRKPAPGVPAIGRKEALRISRTAIDEHLVAAKP